MVNDSTVQDAQEITYISKPDGRYECRICPTRCNLRNGQRGVCLVREADNGVYLKGYGKITHAAVEPIEKKPIYHYKPNLKTLSIGGYGCPLSCGFCQNYMVSQEDRYFSSKDLLPQHIIDIAIIKECKAVCFTYNEPIIYYEYILDLAKLCKENKIDLLLKTSAYAELPIWKKLCSLTNAMNIDWKGNEERYKSVAKVSGKSIIECIQFAIENIHTEISIPIYHDASVQEHEEFAEFMSSYPLVPLHLLRIYPAYRDIGCQVTSTPILKKIGDLYKKNSKYVYLQNMHDQVGFLDTFCPKCNDLVASRASLCTVVKKFSCCNCPIIKE